MININTELVEILKTVWCSFRKLSESLNNRCLRIKIWFFITSCKWVTKFPFCYTVLLHTLQKSNRVRNRVKTKTLEYWVFWYNSGPSKTDSLRFARLSSSRIELTQSLSNNTEHRYCLPSSSLTNLRKHAFDVVSKWRSPNTLCWGFVVSPRIELGSSV